MSAGTVAAVAYGLSAIWAFRLGMRWVTESWAGGPDWEGVILGVMAGYVAAVFGPFVVVGDLLRRSLGQNDPTQFVRMVAGEGREARAKRLAREAGEREQYIARLERELGIGA